MYLARLIYIRICIYICLHVLVCIGEEAIGSFMQKLCCLCKAYLSAQHQVRDQYEDYEGMLPYEPELL